MDFTLAGLFARIEPTVMLRNRLSCKSYRWQSRKVLISQLTLRHALHATSKRKSTRKLKARKEPKFTPLLSLHRTLRPVVVVAT